MASYTVEALILRARSLGEADRILTLFSHEEGKFDAVARGSRRPRNRMVGVSQPFIYAQFHLFGNRKGLDTISQAEIQDAYTSLHEDLEKSIRATYLCELLSAFLPEREPNPAALDLIRQAFRALIARADGEIVCRAFELRLLGLLGYRPQMETCVVCQGTLEGFSAQFHTDRSGLVCERCLGASVNSLTEVTVAFFPTLQDGRVSKLASDEVSAVVRRELFRALGHLVEYYIEKPLQSRCFLPEAAVIDSDIDPVGH